LCDNLLLHLRPEACGAGLGARPGVHLEGLGSSSVIDDRKDVTKSRGGERETLQLGGL
jgi:hypothetical protein